MSDDTQNTILRTIIGHENLVKLSSPFENFYGNDFVHFFRLFLFLVRKEISHFQIAPPPLFNFQFLKDKEFFVGVGSVFLWAISLLRVVVPFPKIVMFLTRIYEKQHCKGEPYRFSVQQDPLVHIDRQTQILLLL